MSTKKVLTLSWSTSGKIRLIIGSETSLLYPSCLVCWYFIIPVTVKDLWCERERERFWRIFANRCRLNACYNFEDLIQWLLGVEEGIGKTLQFFVETPCNIYFLDGWTKTDLIYVWKDKGAVQFPSNFSLPGGFKVFTCKQHSLPFACCKSAGK